MGAELAVEGYVVKHLENAMLVEHQELFSHRWPDWNGFFQHDQQLHHAVEIIEALFLF